MKDIHLQDDVAAAVLLAIQNAISVGGNAGADQPPLPAVTSYVGPGGVQVDDIVPRGTPGTVYMPVSGRVLSVADPREGIVGYNERISDQLAASGHGGGLAVFNASATLNQTSSAIGVTADQSGWPEALDRYWNKHAYLTPEQLAAERAGQAGWAASGQAQG